MVEFWDARGLLGTPEALRTRADEEGYLFFRGLLPPERLLQVRRDILGVLRDAGWLEPGTDPMEGRARREATCVEGEEAFAPVYDEVMKLESFHALAHAPELLRLFRGLFGEEVLVHPRNIARLIFPRNVLHTTPAHQDFVHVQGTPETWTAWMPLSDCPRELGPVSVLVGSHRQGIYPTHAAYGAGGLGIDTERLPFEWAVSDFALGDVLVFHSLVVHRALPNQSPDLLRLSVDYRYQPVSHPVEAGSLKPHHGRLSWEEVYRGWSSDRFQRYWEGLDLTVVSYDPSIRGLAEPLPISAVGVRAS